ncbi:hypothetical protein GWO43_22905, partial [candidate division KSB1 bacterium]|nr:hypothetical protein [candidate division KSB1 bacterium]NIR72836.1 hypothetical protein [candidate division KSB1 bacterium]NIS26876.1 hypothetical protein [candidate division KSB1 bacterium]NIT73672.1 hypothetical protein [candidate division KSB1 bacterium]NIU27543.1 hypothetical protein [candidate division KSB1 bacterium]
MANRERSLIPGVILILLGLYFLLDRLNVFYFRWEYLYPLILLGLGVLFLVAIFTKKDKGAAFPATILLILGLFFFLRNYGLLPYEFYLYYIEDYWPIFLIAFGLGFLVLFSVKPEDWGVLIPGGILLFFGVVFLLRNMRLFYWRDFADFWPVILIAIGLGIVVSSLRK